MESIANFSATPNDAHAATGAKAGPLILPIIEICEAGMLEMFHRKLGDTEAHGSSGHAHLRLSARIPFSFWRMFDSLAVPDDGGTGSLWIVAASVRYCCSPSLFAAQYDCHSGLALIQSPEPVGSSPGSRGAAASASPPRCARSAAQRSGAAQNSFHLCCARS